MAVLEHRMAVLGPLKTPSSKDMDNVSCSTSSKSKWTRRKQWSFLFFSMILISCFGNSEKDLVGSLENDEKNDVEQKDHSSSGLKNRGAVGPLPKEVQQH